MLELAVQVVLPHSRQFGSVGNASTMEFDTVIDLAVARQCPEWLEWAIGHTFHDPHRGSRRIRPPALGCLYDPRVDVWRLVLQHCRGGDTVLLDVLKRSLPVDDDELERLVSRHDVAHDVTNIDLLDWLRRELPPIGIEGRVARAAMYRGDVAMLQYIRNLRHVVECDPRTFADLYYDGQWDVLAFVLEHDLGEVDDDAARAMIESDEDAVRALVSRFPHRFQHAFEGIVRRFVEWGTTRHAWLRSILDRGIFSTEFGVAINGDVAAMREDLELVQLLHGHGLSQFTTDAMDGAAEEKHWDVVLFLRRHRHEGGTTRTIDAAATQGRLNRVPIRLESTMTNAAKDVLRFLHEHTSVGCTTRAMDSAATDGHLHVVQFLHTRRVEGCTVDAMNGAAANGHLKVVRFLHEHRSEGCTVQAIHGALRNHHAHMVHFLREHYPHLVGEE